MKINKKILFEDFSKEIDETIIFANENGEFDIGFILRCALASCGEKLVMRKNSGVLNDPIAELKINWDKYIIK